MKKLCAILRSLALLLYGAGLGSFLSAYLVHTWKWRHPFLFIILGWCMLLPAGFLIHARTQAEREELKAKAVKRYDRMRNRFGDKMLKCVRYTGFALMLTGLLVILFAALLPNVTQSAYPIALGVMFAGFFLALPFVDPSAGNIRIRKQKENHNKMPGHIP